ncbi:ComEC/Rec2 family competence protein [Paludibacterium denitrificans]|uniref:ComEC/Rec2 family competence protein n=1 Tax=Paludibacterium denitrificans TaxID=2675226 RepID=UPI001E297527|nr:ComEC/Rec2 family competence protein [Paludibacterium denitrificans]
MAAGGVAVGPELCQLARRVASGANLADWQQQPIELVGVVRGLPDASEFGWRLTLQVERVLTAGVTVPSRVQLTDYRGGNWLKGGSRWQLTVRLKQRHASANPYGFDAEQWMWSEGLLASGAIGKNPQRLADADDARAYIDRLRAAVVARIEQALGPGREAALIAALTVGDQQGIDRADWALFARTGLTHLVSISGLHITMVAGLAGLLARALLRRWPTRRVPPRVVVAYVTLAVATFYAVLAGLSVPTQRTLFMLAVVVLMLLWRRASSPFQIWWLALTLVLLLDPFAVLAPGLWLSFGLVAALMASTLGRRRPPGKWRAALAGQWAVLVMSLVPLLVFFGNVPLLSPLANALAIPLVSGLLTPLSLLAVALPWDGGLQLAAAVVRLFYLGVDWLAQWPPWSLPGQPWPLLALALGGTCWLIAPRGVPGRALGACLLLPLLVFRPTLPAPGSCA